MKVAFLTEYFRPFEIGGAERSAERLAVSLASEGIAVTVITPNYGAPAHDRIGGAAVWRPPFPQRIAPGQLARRAWLSNPALHAAYGVGIGRHLRSGGYSLVHVQNSGLLLAGRIAARRAGIPIVVTVRDLAYLPPATHPAGQRPADASRVKWKVDAWWAERERSRKRAALLDASAVVFVSDALLELYVSHRVALPRIVRVVPNIGPAVDGAPPAERDRRCVLFVGKLSTGKGLHLLYGAAAHLATRMPDARIVLVGLPGAGYSDPPPALAHMFRREGRVDSAGVRDLMRRAGVLVAPSVWAEPLSRVLLEAMSTGTPIVATAMGGNAEAVEHERSALLVAGEPAGLADAMVRILTDVSLADRLGRAAQERVGTFFSPGAVVPRIAAVYRDACSAG